MDFPGADADLRAESEPVAIAEPRWDCGKTLAESIRMKTLALPASCEMIESVCFEPYLLNRLDKRVDDFENEIIRSPFSVDQSASVAASISTLLCRQFRETCPIVASHLGHPSPS